MADGEKKIVIVVDDNRTDLTVAGLLIQKEGFEPMLFETFAEMSRFMKTEKDRVCLVMLDVNMPGLTGVDMLKRLKKEVFARGVPIVMMTGDSSAQTVKTCILNGAVDYMVKPLDPMVFESKLGKLTGVDNRAKRDEWVEYRLNQIKENKVVLQVPGSIVSIGELSMTINSEYPVIVGSVFMLDTTIFRDVGITLIPMRVETCSEAASGAGFHLKCGIIGLSEAELQKIRVFCRSLWRNNLATG